MNELDQSRLFRRCASLQRSHAHDSLAFVNASVALKLNSKRCSADPSPAGRQLLPARRVSTLGRDRVRPRCLSLRCICCSLLLFCRPYLRQYWNAEELNPARDFCRRRRGCDGRCRGDPHRRTRLSRDANRRASVEVRSALAPARIIRCACGRRCGRRRLQVVDKQLPPSFRSSGWLSRYPARSDRPLRKLEGGASQVARLCLCGRSRCGVSRRSALRAGQSGSDLYARHPRGALEGLLESCRPTAGHLTRPRSSCSPSRHS